MPESARLIPDCRVSVDGQKLESPDSGRLTSVQVDLDAELFGRCEIVFNDPRMELIGGKKFQSGTAVKVEIGFATRLVRVFEGEVVALEPRFVRDRPPALHVVCQESIHRLALSPRTRALNDVDDHDVATRIAQEHGLSAEAPSGTRTHMLQGNVTDALFLRRLAQKDGNQLRIEGKKLIIGPPSAETEVKVAPGDGLRKIKVAIKSLQQVSELTVHGWDPKTRQEIVGKAAPPPGEAGEGARQHGGERTISFAGHEHAPVDVASAEKMAKGRLARIAEGFITAELEMIGDPRVVPGARVELDKLGAQIDGTWRVDKAVHLFSKRGYVVKAKMARVSRQTSASRAAQKLAEQAQAQDATPREQEAGPRDTVFRAGIQGDAAPETAEAGVSAELPAEQADAGVSGEPSVEQSDARISAEATK